MILNKKKYETVNIYLSIFFRSSGRDKDKKKRKKDEFDDEVPKKKKKKGQQRFVTTNRFSEMVKFLTAHVNN